MPVTFKDVPQQEQEGGQRDKRHGRPRVFRVPAVLPVPAHHIHVPRSGLPSALAGLFTAHRVYHTVSQWTGHLRSEDVAEPREPHVVQLIGPYPRVRKVQMVLMTLPELDGPLPRLMTGEPRMQEVICGISQGLYRRVRAGSGENAYP